MQLTLYDFDGNELGFSDKVISSYRESVFNGIGTSEFHLELSDPIFKIIRDNQYLILEEDGIFQDIIIGYKTDEELTLYCRSLSWLLSKMIIPPLSYYEKISNIVSYMLSNSYGCDISLGSLPSITDYYNFQNEKASLFSDSVKACLDTVNAGHSVRFSHEDNRFYLDILSGNELNFYVSENDCTLDKLTFNADLIDLSNSVCFLKKMSYMGEWNPHKNSPLLTNNIKDNYAKYYAINTEGEGVATLFGLTWANGTFIYSDTTSGKFKKSSTRPEDFYVYSTDTTVNSKYQWFHISDKNTKDEAISATKELCINKDFTAESRNLSFLDDYNLGDFVKLQYTLNGETISVPCQFSSVVLNRDISGKTEKPTLKEVK